MAFSPDGRLLATGSWDATARLGDASTGKEVAALPGHKAGLLRCAFTPDGRSLATSSDDRTIKLWQVATFREVATFSTTKGVFYLAFSPDGQTLAANDPQNGVCFFRAPALEEILRDREAAPAGR